MSAKTISKLTLAAVFISVASCGLKQTSESELSAPQNRLEKTPQAAQPSAPASDAVVRNLSLRPQTKAKPGSGATASAPVAESDSGGRPPIKAKVMPSEKQEYARSERKRLALPSASFAAPILAPSEDVDRESYQHYQDNPIKLAREEPVSTFSIDVDSGSYTNARRMLNEGRLPVTDAVRAEEFINYFNYDYPDPDGEQAFSFSTEIGPSPWNHDAFLLHIGIQGKHIAQKNLPPSNLVFLVDVSGSMQSPNKLGLLVKGLKMLSAQLRHQDRVALVVYAGASGLVLDSTSGDDKHKIIAALDNLRAGGSTNGASGIRLAYQTARSAFIENGSNRIILATDGDFNVGTVDFNALLDLVARERKSGIELTTLGFGSGNYNDKLLEQLADVGNGNYAYIDSIMEAQKTLVEQLGGTLHTIAKDVKIQIEFNPNVVAEYRLIGYENRKLRREDFNNDNIDAGEIGAGHTVTALYEIVLVGSKAAQIDPLRYGDKNIDAEDKKDSELAFLKLRYKQPKSDTSQLVSKPISVKSINRTLESTSNNFRFAASVAAFAQILRGAKYLSDSEPGFDLQRVVDLAQQAKGQDLNGYRSEYIRLVKLSQALMPTVASVQR